MTKVNDFKGFGLFNDIDDVDLRNRNRAVVLANMAEDNIDRKSHKVSQKGTVLILGYFMQIPPEDRDDVQERFAENMRQRGFGLK